jgi:hypothetical protein
MVIVMEMSTGKTVKMSEAEAAAADAATEFGEFVDEVLGAGWLPQPALRLEVQEHQEYRPEHHERKVPPVVDADEFLRTLYRNQE